LWRRRTPTGSGGLQAGKGADDADVHRFTRIVATADPQAHETSIEGETYIIPEEGGGACLFPPTGAEVAL
jgi:hypothetical protein